MSTTAAEDEIIDLTAQPAQSESAATQDLLRRLQCRRSPNQTSPGIKLTAEHLSENVISPSSVTLSGIGTGTSTIERSTAAHTSMSRIAQRSVEPPAVDSSSNIDLPSPIEIEHPAASPTWSSSDDVVLVKSSSSPLPKAQTRLNTPSTLPLLPPSLSPLTPFEADTSGMTIKALHTRAIAPGRQAQPSIEAAAAPVNPVKRKASPEPRGGIFFSKLPRDAGPTADYPILQGLDLQRRKASAQSPRAVVKRTKRSKLSQTALASPAGERRKGCVGRSLPTVERPILPRPALEYELPSPTPIEDQVVKHGDSTGAASHHVGPAVPMTMR